MQITKDTVVTMHYTLTGPDGGVIDTSEGKQPLAYLHGSGNIIPGLESQLEGRASGDQLVAEIPAAEGYGDRDPNQVVQANRSQFPEGVDLQPGMRFQAETPAGPRLAEITAIDGDDITVDTNHPLAGVDLRFDVNIVDVRAATDEEVAHGHVHREGGCGDGCGCH